MAWYFAVRCLLMHVLTACVLGSHFRGAIFMARPSPGGGENEVSEIQPSYGVYIGLQYCLHIQKIPDAGEQLATRSYIARVIKFAPKCIITELQCPLHVE